MGDVNVAIDVESKDEIGVLAESFRQVDRLHEESRRGSRANCRE